MRVCASRLLRPSENSEASVPLTHARANLSHPAVASARNILFLRNFRRYGRAGSAAAPGQSGAVKLSHFRAHGTAAHNGAHQDVPDTRLCAIPPIPQSQKISPKKCAANTIRRRCGGHPAAQYCQAAAGSMKYSTRLFLNSRSLKSMRYSLIPICDCIVLAVSAASSRVRQCIMEKTVYGQSGYAGRW